MAAEDDDAYARAPEPEDVVRVCRALEAAGARYLLIGGFAVIAHGAGRFTRDIDQLEVIIDLMGRACGLDYAAASADAETIERDGVPIRVASPATLIRTKDTPRPQDAIDRAFLAGVIEARRART